MNGGHFCQKSGKKGQWVNVSDDLKGCIQVFVMSVEGMLFNPLPPKGLMRCMTPLPQGPMAKMRVI